MTTPQAKRRRLDEATKILHRPFKSPFRRPPASPTSSDPPSSDPLDMGIPVVVTPAVSLSFTAAAATSSESGIPNAAKLLRRPNLSTPARPEPTKRSPKPSLARDITQLRNEVQMLTQAQSLVTSTQDEDLLVLIDRWRTASRAAAEELFASTRDRVNRMGGVGAWREREKEQREWMKKAEMEEMEAERVRLEKAKENEEGSEWVNELPREVQTDEQEGETDEFSKVTNDESFTMDMMLKTLNIDLSLIGYSVETQRWDE